jgi:polyhydroxyalkanoate synthase
MLESLQVKTETEELATEFETIFKHNKYRLVYYRPKNEQSKTPIIIVPSIINKAYILDLLKSYSLVEFLSANNYPVYLIDWGTPSDEDRFIEFDAYINTHLNRLVRKAIKDSQNRNTNTKSHIGILGYCMGGTLSTIYTALYPHNISYLVNLLAPIDFSKAGMLREWTDQEIFDPNLPTAAYGNMGASLMQNAFESMRPLTTITKHVKTFFHPTPECEKKFFDRLEQWASDNIPFPGKAYQKYIKDLYQDNKLIKGTLTIGSRRVNLKNINHPCLNFSADRDHIVPPESAECLRGFVKSDDYENSRIKGGHVAAVVGPRGRKELWPKLLDWLDARQI